MRNGCVSRAQENAQDDVKIKAMHKRMRKMICGYKIEPLSKVFISYGQEKAQDDVWVQNLRYA